jgi:hypothetical protein
MITLLLIIPIIGSLLLVPITELDSTPEMRMSMRRELELELVAETEKIKNSNRKLLIKQIALITSLLNLIVAIIL